MLTEKQTEFCKQIVGGKSATEAYRTAFKSKSAGTCKVNGSKLLKQPLIKAKVKELQDANRVLTERANEIAAANLAEGEIANKAERLKVLTQIMRGEIEIPTKEAKWDSKQGKFVMIPAIELPDHHARIKALAELNKMDGAYELHNKQKQIKIGVEAFKEQYED